MNETPPAMEQAEPRVVEYEYDYLHRLIEERISNVETNGALTPVVAKSYYYDQVGNRLLMIEMGDENDIITTYDHDDNDRLTNETRTVQLARAPPVAGPRYVRDPDGAKIQAPPSPWPYAGPVLHTLTVVSLSTLLAPLFLLCTRTNVPRRRRRGRRLEWAGHSRLRVSALSCFVAVSCDHCEACAGRWSRH